MSAQEATYLPLDDDGDHQLARVANFLDAFRAKKGEEPEPQYFLSGPNPSDHVPLPRQLYEILVQSVEALQSGKAVTIRPNEMQVTTQQAADILGVSRPTVVRLIESGQLDAERITRHRRLRLTDVLHYRDKKREEQLDFIASTSQHLDEEPSSEDFKRVRQAVAERKRKKQTE